MCLDDHHFLLFFLYAKLLRNLPLNYAATANARFPPRGLIEFHLIISYVVPSLSTLYHPTKQNRWKIIFKRGTSDKKKHQQLFLFDLICDCRRTWVPLRLSGCFLEDLDAEFFTQSGV